MMNKLQSSANGLVLGAVMFSLFAAPAITLAATRGDQSRSVSGVGLVLMVTLQRNAG